MSVPEINVHDFGAMLESTQDFIILDVREAWEVAQAKWSDERVRFAPMSELAQRGIAPLEEVKPVVVVCHHGVRSYQVTNWLLMQGWQDVVSLRGGIEAYALQVDASVGRY